VEDELGFGREGGKGGISIGEVREAEFRGEGCVEDNEV
jgi:hypothetical protein